MNDMLSLEQFIPLLTEKPAAFLRLNSRKGKIAVGYDADLVVWDPETQWEVKEPVILHRHKITPYIGAQLYGIVKRTIVAGIIAYDEKEGVATEKSGQIILAN
jgi:allantoinase